MPRTERILLWSAAAAALLLRALAFFRYRFDSDEQQHLHVAWGWTAGLVQYRDLFDNHPPLFHLLTAPLLAALGERSDILLWMRAPMLVVFASILYCTWLLGRQLYDDRLAIRAVLLLALFPPFFLKSLEYRPDGLWAALVLVALVGLIRGWRPFVIGLLLGAALTVSMKTTLLVAALVIAGAVVMWIRRKRAAEGGHLETEAAGFPARDLLQAAAGLAMVPAIIAVCFAAAGAWDELLYCNFVFNGQLAITRKILWVGRATFPLTFGAVLYGAWRFRTGADSWRYFLAVFLATFTVLLASFWVLISPRDFLAVMPLAAIFAGAAIARSANPLRTLAITLAVFVLSLFHYADRFENRTDWHITMMDQTLRLTRPGEWIVDHKGETIYRRRAFRYPLEIVSRTLLARHRLPDTIPEDVVRTRTYVAQADGVTWPPRGRMFLNENFLNVGRLRAAGQFIESDGTFSIAIPGEYVILDARGEVRGLLDGTPYVRPRQLAAGSHRFAGPRGAAVLWAPAFRRGHSPFHLRDTEF